MAYAAPIEAMSGRIREVTIGTGDKAVVIGGESALAFHRFDGDIPNRARIAVEISDVTPIEWPKAIDHEYADVYGDPVAWAKKAESFGAEIITLTLQGADPNGEDKSPDACGEIVKAVLAATDLPLIVLGCGNAEKDSEVLKKVAEVAQDRNVLIGPAVQDNYKSVAGSALGYRQNVITSTPIDVNLAKQLNILVGQLGLPAENVVMEPSTGGQSLGYGIEYSYSVMERDRLAALAQNDEVMQAPLICNLAREAWKAKEAKADLSEQPTWGDLEKRGILWESITAVSMLTAGANVLIMRHPKAIALVKKFIDGMSA